MTAGAHRDASATHLLAQRPVLLARMDWRTEGGGGTGGRKRDRDGNRQAEEERETVRREEQGENC